MNRLHQTKANINSVQLNMKQQMAMAKVSGAFEKSTQVMKAMSKLVRVPEVMKTMQARFGNFFSIFYHYLLHLVK